MPQPHCTPRRKRSASTSPPPFSRGNEFELNGMIEFIEKLVSALREELQHYGEMLARLDDQQELVMRRAPVALLETIPAVQTHSATLTQAREVRFGAMKALCTMLRLPIETAFKDLLPHLPA